MTAANQLDKMLEEYAAVSRTVAADTKSQLLDLRKEFLAHLRQHNRDNAKKGILTTDGVHLNADGNEFVARQMLAAVGVGTSKKGVGSTDKVLRHIVLFKFKDDVAPSGVNEVVAAFGSLPSKIDTIIGYEQGTNVSPENKAEGFTHCFLVTFRDAAGRDSYLPHPAHQEFVSIVKPRVDKVLVFDYWAEP